MTQVSEPVQAVDPAAQRRAKRDFWLLWTGQTSSLWGDQFMVLALPLLAVNLLHTSAAEALLLSSALFLPFLVLGLPAGAIVDRLRRRVTMVVANAVQATAFALVWLLAANDSLHFVVLFALMLLSGCALVFFQAAYNSFLPTLYSDPRDLHRGNAWLQFSESTSQSMGRVVGGIVLRLLGVIGAVGADTLSFIASGVTLLAIRTPEPPPRPGQRDKGWLRRDIAVGLRFVWGHPFLQPMLACGTLYLLFLGMVDTCLVLYCRDVMGLSQTWIGVVLGAAAAGYPVGNLLSARVSERLGRARAMILGITWSVVGFVIMIALSTPGGAAGAVGLVAGSIFHGIGEGIYLPASMTVRHTVTPPELLGRVSSVQRFFMWGALSLGAILASAVTALVGLRGAVWAGSIAALSCVPALTRRGVLAEARAGRPVGGVGPEGGPDPA